MRIPQRHVINHTACTGIFCGCHVDGAEVIIITERAHIAMPHQHADPILRFLSIPFSIALFALLDSSCNQVLIRLLGQQRRAHDLHALPQL